MYKASPSNKETGDRGEDAATHYLKEQGFKVIGRNITRKTGEIDVLAEKGGVLHFVEVKTLSCREFPDSTGEGDRYDPSANLHGYKIRKVVRTAEWIVAERDFEGEWQVDGALVWLRERDGVAQVEYLPQIA
jgi:putative endonuclease